MQSQFYGCVFIVLLGALFGMSFSKQTFQEAVIIKGVPTPTRYLVRRGPFVLGQFAFVVFCLSAYAFMLIFYQQIPHLVEFLPDAAQSALSTLVKTIKKQTETTPETESSLLVIVVAITTTFLFVLKNH